MRCWSSSPGSYTLHCKSRHFNLRLKQRNGCDTWRGPHRDVLNCLHVRVEHPQCIAVPSSKALWKLFKAATPQHAWEDVAVSLACLESLYRVEFSQAAEECIAAFNAANSAPVPVDAETKSEQQQQQQQHDEQAGDEVAAAASAAVKAVTTAVAVAANAGESPPEPQQQPSEEQLMQAAAEQADRVLAAHIKYLADRSHFQAFTRRDCELGKTLNQGYQGQLFIQSNDCKLDKSLLRAFTAKTGPSSGEGAQQSAVPQRGPGQQVVQSCGSDSVGEQQGSIVGQESDQQVALGESFSVDPGGSEQRGVRIHWSDPWRVREDDCVEESMDVQQRSAPGGDPDQHTAQDDTSEDDVDAQQNGMPAGGSDQCVRHGNHDENPVNAQQDDHNRDPVYAQQDNQNRNPVNSRQDNLNRNIIDTLRDNHRPDQHALLEESRSAVLSARGAHLSSLRGRGPDQWGLSAHFHSVPGCGLNQGGVSGAHSNSLPGCGPDDWIMHDTGVVVMKRGFSRETATGMLLLPKLDYLQTAVVEEALLRIRLLLHAGWQGLLHRSQRSLADASDTLAKENTEQEMGPTSLLERATRAGESNS
ncbi:hypothetical protein DUNSADRAFT_3103 [Dunaliella salina]|uniref:Uncharacterized protein n=1 Tax=Dunaliella salina TaxID=3046 RepID=A0ABQ7FVM1_DUNSA|nr:hypothetical protein DUNSADRAFT_3103 [Dunaliella salina]|eukprot:KAF5826439.1 hypothetical protein DUNSADRAFT_3103 [Dunaliella salina]